MYFDEDGDLAHEFYVEVFTSRGPAMRREPLERLRPQVRHVETVSFDDTTDQLLGYISLVIPA